LANFERFASERIYPRVVSNVRKDGYVCSSYGLLGVRSHGPPLKGRLLCFRSRRFAGKPKETLASLAEQVFDGSLPVGVPSAED